ncbi:hypothetical protein JTB14_009740 [Gonioctena quinquepunctata]|nr:hypothetical protein JTB14_009740 [Gonioctena quinquepunctata]
MQFHLQLVMMKPKNHIINRVPEAARLLSAAALAKFIKNCLKYIAPLSMKKTRIVSPMMHSMCLTIKITVKLNNTDQTLSPAHIISRPCARNHAPRDCKRNNEDIPWCVSRFIAEKEIISRKSKSAYKKKEAPLDTSLSALDEVKELLLRSPVLEDYFEMGH